MSAPGAVVLSGSVVLAGVLSGTLAAQTGPGVYRLDSSSVVAITPLPTAILQYRIFDSGLTARLLPCDTMLCAGPDLSSDTPVELRVTLPSGGRPGSWQQVGARPRTLSPIELKRTPVAFTSRGASLRGYVLQPPRGEARAAVVFVHGSGRHAATLTAYSPWLLAAHGVAVLVFDKRGTGSSGGKFTMDFSVLADDVSAAVDALADVSGIDTSGIGLVAYSQGGWVAPLAALRNPRIRFVVVSYGMIDSPFEEERVQTLEELRSRGLSADELAAADTLTRAAIHVVASNFRAGWDSLHAAARRYEGRAWMRKLKGTTPGELLRYPSFIVRLLGPRRAPPGLSWYYDSRETLGALNIPMTWLLAGDDRSAPNTFTIAELDRLRAVGKRYETIVFPGADHGMLLYRVDNGARRYTRHPPDYFTAELTAIRTWSDTNRR